MAIIAATGLVAFREAFEAALLVSIILLVLTRLNRGHLKKYAYMSTGVSVAIGALLGAAVYALYKSIPQQALFEAVSAYIAAAVLVTVIIWMARHGPHLKQELEEKLAKAFTPWAVGLISFVFVFREVIETILITAPFLVQDPLASVAGITIGSVGAVALVAGIYYTGLKVNLRRFFMATSIVLVFVASGLIGYGTHELLEWAEERGIELGVLGKYVYKLDLSEGNPLHPDNIVGGILSVMLGWYHYMELARFMAQGSFLAVGLFYVLRAYKLL